MQVMDSTRQEARAAPDGQYGVEVLCAGWNPLIACSVEPIEACRSLIADLAGMEVEAFLARVYRFQQG